MISEDMPRIDKDETGKHTCGPSRLWSEEEADRLGKRIREQCRQWGTAGADVERLVSQYAEARKTLRRNREFHDLLVKVLHCSMDDGTRKQLLERFLELATGISWTGTGNSGVVFLRENDQLILKASRNIPLEICDNCRTVPLGSCLCGKAAAAGQPLFAGSDSPEHDRALSKTPPHTHYCIPIVQGEGEVLGVLCLFFDAEASYDREVEGLLMSCAGIIAGFLERKTSAERLERRTELLSSIYSALDSVGLIVVDLEEADARITSFSPGAEKLFGYSQEEALDQSIAIIHPPENQASIRERVRLLKSGQSFQSLVMLLKRRSGDRFPAVVSVHPMIGKNNLRNRAVGVFRDISELMKIQQKLEERVEQRTMELQVVQRQFLHAEKLTAIGKLSSSIAHEFNNPLQSVLSILKGVRKRAQLEEEDVPLVEAAIGECNRMKDLIRNLQDFHRPSSGKRVVMDLHKNLDSVLLLFRSDFKKMGISIALDLAPSLPQIMAIPDQIKQVLLNLLNNAMDACTQGGRIAIRTRQEGAGVSLRISDNGVGIHPDNLERVFEPFYTTKPDVKGTGLGLSVSYGIIKRHNGSIVVESKVGQGTSFTMFLPIDHQGDVQANSSGQPSHKRGFPAADDLAPFGVAEE